MSSLKKRISWKAGLTFTGCLVILLVSSLRVLAPQELGTYDLRFRLRPPLKSSPDIVIIEISDDTLKNLGQWPLPRDFHASLIEVLKTAGAKRIIFDILFTEPTLYDEAFASAIRAAGNVYLSAAFDINISVSSGYLPAKSRALLANVNKTLAGGSRGIGHINVLVDPDGKTRRVPLGVRHDGQVVPQLGFLVACDEMGADPSKLSVPLLHDGSFAVNYPDTWAKSFRHVSYFEVLKAYADSQRGVRPELDLFSLKGKTCFVGLTATGTSDLKPTPLESVYPMVGLQASVYSSLLQKRFIRDIGPAAGALIGILVFLLSLFISLRLPPLKAFFGNIVFGFSYFVIAVSLFILYGIWADLFFPLLIIVATYTGATFYGFLDETRKRQIIEKELEIARAIQKNFLPQDVKEVAGIDICSFLEPAKFVAGDLYDVFALDSRRAGIFIADVSGKGVPASLIMAQTISLFRIFARQHKTPSAVLSALNKELYGRYEGRFVTCLYLVVDAQARTGQASSAGHGPLLLHKSGASSWAEIELLADVPLAIMEDTAYADVRFDFAEGDKAVVFTDGVPEARDRQGREFGLPNIKKIVTEEGERSAQGLMSRIRDEVQRFSAGALQHDDMTLIVLEHAR